MSVESFLLCLEGNHLKSSQQQVSSVIGQNCSSEDSEVRRKVNRPVAILSAVFSEMRSWHSRHIYVWIGRLRSRFASGEISGISSSRSHMTQRTSITPPPYTNAMERIPLIGSSILEPSGMIRKAGPSSPSGLPSLLNWKIIS